MRGFVGEGLPLRPSVFLADANALVLTPACLLEAFEVLREEQPPGPGSLRAVRSFIIRERGGLVMAVDPVCKMQVDEKKAAAASVYKGMTYYFCAPGCKKAFDSAPEKYLGKA